MLSLFVGRTTGALLHLLKSSLGTGILAMANAFNNAGLLFGTVMTLIVAALCTHCVWILVSLSAHLLERSINSPSSQVKVFQISPLECHKNCDWSRSGFCEVSKLYDTGTKDNKSALMCSRDPAFPKRVQTGLRKNEQEELGGSRLRGLVICSFMQAFAKKFLAQASTWAEQTKITMLIVQYLGDLDSIWLPGYHWKTLSRVRGDKIIFLWEPKK